MSSIERGMWREVLAALNEATVEGLLQSTAATGSSSPSSPSSPITPITSPHYRAFLSALRHSNEVFAAFKVHTLQTEVAAKLLTPGGDLKTFADFRRDCEGILSHQCGSWLQTEYNTAVIRAHNAADWQTYIANEDVMPNLRWLPTTSAEPEPGHRAYWLRRVNLPVSHPFWRTHHPGDHWNCKCSLEQNDDPVVLPDSTASEKPGASEKSEKSRPSQNPPKEDRPDPGLENNPGIDHRTFSDTHPYFPSSCASCPFSKGFKNTLQTLFKNRKKDCYNCKFIDGCISRMAANGFKLENNFKNGGKLYLHPNIEKNKSDYNDMKQICIQFAKMGHEVRMTPRLYYKSEEYRQIYGSLIGTKYENKCPDFSVDGIFYEYEGFVKPWSKRKVGSMLSHGMKQSDCIVINNTKGCSDRFIRKQIIARQRMVPGGIKEVWLYEKGKIRPFLINEKFIK